jgi:ATP adenylyltransferase
MDHLWTPWRMTYLTQASAGDGECVFCAKLAANDDPAHHILYRGEYCFATLNLYPYNNGHLMVVPNRHTAMLEDLSPAELADLMGITQQALRVLRAASNPQGFNIGINQGQAGGAGIADHLHQHIVPRWNGDTNYLSVIAETRTIPEWIDQTYQRLREIWETQFPPNRKVQP